jgi:heme-degrading monooxygenase HmoA
MIRVLIERWLIPGMDEQFRVAMRGMRQDALHAAGYISGETLRDVAVSEHYVVISTWRAKRDWDAWAVSAARETARECIRPMLAAEERTTILEPA